jgi:hypothetical protein
MARLESRPLCHDAVWNEGARSSRWGEGRFRRRHRLCAELDCDIVIDHAPDSLTPQIEQFRSLVELKKYDAAGEIPFRAIVRAMPNLKDKQMFLKDMDKQAARNAQAGQEAEALPLRGAEAEVAETESKAALNAARARGEGSKFRSGRAR